MHLAVFQAFSMHGAMYLSPQFHDMGGLSFTDDNRVTQRNKVAELF